MMRFDDALPRFALIVKNVLGDEALLTNFFLRDPGGKLTFVYVHGISEDAKKAIIEGAQALLPYVEDGEAAIASPDELFDPIFSQPDVGVFEWIAHPVFTGFVRLFERRIVGQDWLEAPQEPIENAPPIVVFGSHKGGVGRSTALAVAANAFAERDLSVLVLDLDLEAPGLGGILLPAEANSRFGTLDYFVETTFADVDDQFLEDMIAVSPLTNGRGRVHVCPAIGSEGESYPQNVLGKIARAYLETSYEGGQQVSFLSKTRRLVARLAERTRYDAIFVDARAGLNEATAAAFLGLGADVLLFGVSTPQTFRGYRYLLSYLQRFRPPASDESDWRYRLRMVHAKASPDPRKQSEFRTQAFELFADTIYDVESGVDEESFNFDYEDETAPHFAWPILNDSNYDEFNPVAQSDQFAKPIYERTFGPFLNALFEHLNLSEQS